MTNKNELAEGVLHNLDIYDSIADRIDKLEGWTAECEYDKIDELIVDSVNWFNELDDDDKSIAFIYTIGRIVNGPRY